MRDFVITTESNSDLPKEYLLENEIGIIPHYYSVDEKMYGDGEELTIKEFYDAMRDGKKVATMASNPEVIHNTFENYVKQGKDILHISFSSELSGGCANVMSGGRDICEEYPGTKVIVIDSQNASLGEGLLIRKAVELKKQGKTIEETAEWLENNKLNICIQFTVDDLNHLYRGGRVSRTSAILGTMIHVKPILYVTEEGKLSPLDKTRGRKKSLAMLVDNMEARVGSFRDKQDVIGIIHGDAIADAEYISELIKERFGYDNFLICPIGPSIGAHSGPGTIGLVFWGEKR